MAEWLVETAWGDAGALGEALARAIPGEWRQVAGPPTGYRRVLDPARRDQDGRDLAEVVAGFILDHRLGPWTAATTRHHHPYLTAPDMDLVAARALGRLLPTPRAYDAWRADASRRVGRWLGGSDRILVDAVPMFLLRPLREAVERAVDAEADGLVRDQDHQRFLGFLGRCVLQERTFEGAVHVIPMEHGWSLQDADGGLVAAEILADMSFPRDGGPSDAVIAALVALAPRHIVLHGDQRPGGPSATLRAVFGGRMAACAGCGRCGGGAGPVDATPPGR